MRTKKKKGNLFHAVTEGRKVPGEGCGVGRTVSREALPRVEHTHLTCLLGHGLQVSVQTRLSLAQIGAAKVEGRGCPPL